MDEVTRVNALLATTLSSDPTLAAQVASWHEGKVPETARWVGANGTTLLVRGVYRVQTGQAVRRMRRGRIGMALWYYLKLYQRSATTAGLQGALDALSALVDGATLPWTDGQALKVAVTQPIFGTDTVAGVDFNFLGYEIKLWALPTA